MSETSMTFEDFKAEVQEVQQTFDVEGATATQIEDTVSWLDTVLQPLLPIGSSLLTTSPDLHRYKNITDEDDSDLPDDAWQEELQGMKLVPKKALTNEVAGRYEGLVSVVHQTYIEPKVLGVWR